MLTTPARHPRDQRAPAPPPRRSRPPLRVVTDAELAERRRRARARRLVAAAVVLVASGLFAVVVAHVLLMQGQFELQRLQERSSKAQAEYDRLRLQVSDLESPDRIVAVAQEKLGMVTPPTITYLAPSAGSIAASSLPEDGAGHAAAGVPRSDRWSSVKAHLAGG